VKFRSERDSLVEALSTAGRAIAARGSSSPVLSGVRLRCRGNDLEVTGTDLDLTIVVSQEVIGLEDGECVVPGRLIADVVRSLEPGAVTVERTEDKVEISAARSRFALRAFPEVEFPAITLPKEPEVILPAALVGEGLRQVVGAASHDDARPLLTGVLLTSDNGVMRLVATDSYRLALRNLEGAAALGGPAFTPDGSGLDAPGGSRADILVPARALGELQRLVQAAVGASTSGSSSPTRGPSATRTTTPAPDTGEADDGAHESAVQTVQTVQTAKPGVVLGVSADPRHITFTCGKAQISTRLLDGEYPDYRQLMPAHYPNSLHVGKETLLSALRRVRLLVRDNTTSVRLSMRPGGVDLTVVSQEVGDASETVDGDFSGEDLVIAFNPTYLIEGVDAVMDDEVLIEVADPSQPATVRAAERSDFRYLLMPVRVS